MCGNNDNHNHEPMAKRNQTAVDLEEAINNAEITPIVSKDGVMLDGHFRAAALTERTKRTNG